MNKEPETFTITVVKNSEKSYEWTTVQLVQALLEKGGLLDVSLIIAHPSGKTK